MAKTMTAWTCSHCQTKQPEALLCASCSRARYASLAVMVAEHVLEHLADGLSEPLDILKAMQDRPVYARLPSVLTLAFVAQQMRLLTKDTSTIARQLAKARASRTMLEVLETGDTKDKLAVLKGIQVLGDEMTIKGDMRTTVTHIHEDDADPSR